MLDWDWDTVRDVQEGHGQQELQGAGRHHQAEVASLPLQWWEGCVYIMIIWITMINNTPCCRRMDTLCSYSLYQELYPSSIQAVPLHQGAGRPHHLQVCWDRVVIQVNCWALTRHSPRALHSALLGCELS